MLVNYSLLIQLHSQIACIASHHLFLPPRSPYVWEVVDRGDHDRRLRQLHRPDSDPKSIGAWSEIFVGDSQNLLFSNRIWSENSDFRPINQLNIQKQTSGDFARLRPKPVIRSENFFGKSSTLWSDQKTPISKPSTNWTSLIVDILWLVANPHHQDVHGDSQAYRYAIFPHDLHKSRPRYVSVYAYPLYLCI